MVGLVVLIDRISMPGAHELRSLLRERMSSSSRRSNRSMQIYWRVCLLQNWLIQWCILSVIQIFQQASVQLRTVLQTCRFSSRLTTSIFSKMTSSPLEVPQGTFSTISVCIMRLILKISWQIGIRKCMPGSIMSFFNTPNCLMSTISPSFTAQNPRRSRPMQPITSLTITESRLICLLQLKSSTHIILCTCLESCYTMFLRALRHIPNKLATQLAQQPLNPCYFSTQPHHKSYQLKKAQRYLQKSRENFTVDPTSLVSTKIVIEALVPGFFTNELTLQKLPERKTPDTKMNYFSNSYARITLPLATKPSLRQKLNKLFDKEVRIGRIFELMDSIAAIVSYSHCYGGYTPGTSQANQMVCVTGSVELLQLFDKIDIARDLTIEGYLTHVGKTSMEIEINIEQEDKLRANSIFTMIARSAQNQNKGYEIPSLSFEGLPQGEYQKAMVRLQQGKQNVVRRRKEMQSSYDKTAPSAEDIQSIHKLFLKRKVEAATLSESTNPIGKTLIETCEIMHTQARNIHGKTFGGFLIRNMIELAWVAGCKYAEDFVIMEDLTNIYFKKPVDVGCRLTLKATVTYVSGNRLIVTVEAFTSKFSEKTETLACYMHLISRSSKEMKGVHPETYGESLQYLSSKRAFYELFS